jgi:hypothetical protein
MAKFNLRTSIKHLQIDKANSMVVIASAVTAAIVVFSIVACVSLGKEMAYKNKVINLRNKANKQLVTNIGSVSTLITAYQTFEDSSESVIGTADNNSIVVLDALPSKYDFPALVTSLGFLITNSGSKIGSITGTDNEASATQDSISPKPIEMPFQINATGSFITIQKLISELELSIRPIQISSLTLSGSDSNLQAAVTAKTYYQPEKQIGIQQNVVTNGKTSNRNQGVSK